MIKDTAIGGNKITHNLSMVANRKGMVPFQIEDELKHIFHHSESYS